MSELGNPSWEGESLDMTFCDWSANGGVAAILLDCSSVPGLVSGAPRSAAVGSCGEDLSGTSSTS
jgi:hypothetical protein